MVAAPSVAAPLVVVVFGPTGAGKSTIVNSLAGRTVSPAGILRPTTASPVVACHPAHRRRVRSLAATVVAVEEALFGRICLVDTPDLDSDVVDHAEQARGALAGADAALYVTTPLRYGDAIPHEVLVDVAGRVPTLVVVNREDRRSPGAATDLASRLRESGVPPGAVAVISEQRLGAGGRLPAAATAKVRAFLESLIVP